MSELENENGRIGEIDAPAGAREKNAGFDADVVENAEVGTFETPLFQDASLLDEYEQAGHGDKLIRLRGKEPVGRWKDLTSIGVDGGNRWMAKGGNVGFRMSDTDLVIDIDPRRFPNGDDVFARFLRDFDLPAHPFVLRPRDSAYYQGLFEFLDGDGASYVKHWLLKRKVGLNPHGVAPFTAGKEAMRRLSIGDAEAYLLELFEEWQPPFDFDLVRVDELVDAVPSALRGRSNLRARVSKFLKDEIGAVSHARYTKADKQRPAYQLWSVRNHDIWDNIGASGRIDAYLSRRSDDVLDQFNR